MRGLRFQIYIMRLFEVLIADKSGCQNVYFYTVQSSFKALRVCLIYFKSLKWSNISQCFKI